MEKEEKCEEKEETEKETEKEEVHDFTTLLLDLA